MKKISLHYKSASSFVSAKKRNGTAIKKEKKKKKTGRDMNIDEQGESVKKKKRVKRTFFSRRR